MRNWVAAGAVTTTAAAAVIIWQRNRRLGARVVNAVVNPFMLRQGLTGGAHSELGTLEHVGRVSGTVRQTPVRPVSTPDGFRVVVPLAAESHWARNVLAAGHCRLQWKGILYELDEPRLVTAGECQDLAAPVRLFASALGFRYMRLHRFAESSGTLASSGPLWAAAAVPKVTSVPERDAVIA